MKRLILALALVLLLARPCWACHPGVAISYRQFLPYQSYVAIQAIPACYTAQTPALYGAAYPGYYSAPAQGFAVPVPCPCQQRQLLEAAPAPPIYGADQGVYQPQVMPYASGYGGLGVNTVYGAGLGYRVRYPFGVGLGYGLGGYGRFFPQGIYGGLGGVFGNRLGYGLGGVFGNPFLRGATLPARGIFGLGVGLGRGIAGRGVAPVAFRRRLR